MPKTTKFILTLELEFEMSGDKTGMTDGEIIHAISRKKSYGFKKQVLSKKSITVVKTPPDIRHDIRFGNRLIKYSDNLKVDVAPKDTSKSYLIFPGYAWTFNLSANIVCSSPITYVKGHIQPYTYDMQKKGEIDIVVLEVRNNKTVKASLTKKGISLLKEINPKTKFANTTNMAAYDTKDFEEQFTVLVDNLKTLFKVS